MNGAVKIGILAGGAWLLYEWWQQQQLTAVPGSIPNSALPAPTPGPLGTTVSSSPAPTVDSGLSQQMQSLAAQNIAATGAAGFTVDQWNYFYGKVRGVSVTSDQGESILLALGLTDATRATLVPLLSYLTVAASVGLSGYGGRGMGAASPFLQLRNRGRIIRLPLTTPAVAAIRRGAVARGRNYVPARTSMMGAA